MVLIITILPRKIRLQLMSSFSALIENEAKNRIRLLSPSSQSVAGLLGCHGMSTNILIAEGERFQLLNV